jgi:hypothetical protein
MFGVIFVLALVDQLHACGQVLRLIPGMPEHAPGAGGEQGGDKDEEYESGTNQAPKG